MKKVIIIGGEGNGSIIAACIKDNQVKYKNNEYEVIGFLNDYLTTSDKVDGYPVLGKTSDASKYLNKDDHYFMYGILMIGKGELRETVFNNLNIPINKFATIIHESAFVGEGAVIEPGVMVMANSYIGPKAKIGYCTILKANASASHHTDIGSLCHLSVNSICGAYVTVGKGSDISMGSMVLENRNVGEYSVVGAGSLVTRDIPNKNIYAGTPAKFLREIE